MQPESGTATGDRVQTRWRIFSAVGAQSLIATLGAEIAGILGAPFANRLFKEPRDVWIWQRPSEGIDVTR